jgi:hypothetical protein
LSDQLGPAYLCAHGAAGTLFSFGKEPRCEPSDKLEPVQKITVVPYFKQNMSPIFTLWSCSVSIETVETYVSFFNGKGIISHSHVFAPTDYQSCRSLTSDLDTNPTKFYQISSYTWSNASTPLAIDYQWCCYTKRCVQYRLIIKRYTANINYVSNKMFSVGVQTQSCDPWLPSASCLLPDQTLVWSRTSFSHCNYVPGISVYAERRGNEILSEEGQFAVRLTGVRKVNVSCDNIPTTHHLLETYESLFIAIVQLRKSTIMRPHDSLNKTTTIAFVERSLELTIQNLFTSNFLNICNIQRSRYHYLRSLAI